MWYYILRIQTIGGTMARPTKKRRICGFPVNKNFGPLTGGETEEVVEMSLDEYEVIRLIDFEKLTQEETAKQMDIARTTVQSIYSDARYKLSELLVSGKRLVISGGHYRICRDYGKKCNLKKCRCGRGEVKKNKVTLAIPVKAKDINGNISAAFGRASYFLIYDLKSGGYDFIDNISNTSNNGAGVATAQLIADSGVDLLLLPKCGEKARGILREDGIKLYKTINPNIMENIELFKEDKLEEFKLM